MAEIPERPQSPSLKLYPPPAGEIPEGGVYADLELPRPARAGPPYVAVNMVGTIDGKAAIGGRAGGIGGGADRAAMRNLRASADAVMVGAGTVRAEKISLGVPERLAARRVSRGRPPQPLAVFLTGSGNLPLRANLVGGSPENTVVLVPEDAPSAIGTSSSLSRLARVERVPAAPSGGVDPAGAVGVLRRKYAVERLLVEGGPSLNGTLFARGLVHELFLTLSPKLLGGRPEESTAIVSGSLPASGCAPHPMRLISVCVADDEVFLRYQNVAPHG